MRVLVCGGRDFWNYEMLRVFLDGTAVTEIIEGGALGGDALGLAYGLAHDIPVTTERALWLSEGKSAGPRRNQRMLGYHPDMVVALPGGPGTEDMVRRAQAFGLNVIRLQ